MKIQCVRDRNLGEYIITGIAARKDSEKNAEM